MSRQRPWVSLYLRETRHGPKLVMLLVRDSLDRNRERESEYLNELQKREDNACSWIISYVTYLKWFLDSSGPKFLVMTASLGLGKTMNAAFLVDHLSHARDLPVCVYYCKNEKETTKLSNIYRSLLWQLLTQAPDLKVVFREWYENTKSHSKTDPTQSDDLLRKFIVASITASKQWIFLVLDGLDECDPFSRDALLNLLRYLLRQEAPVKVFISSGYLEAIEDIVRDSTALRIQIHQSNERDRLIATFIAGQVGLPQSLYQELANQLVPLAQGCALWLKLAIEYMGKTRVRSVQGIKEALQKLPSSHTMGEVYWTLFEETCFGEAKNKKVLQRALETLAVACRPLTLGELRFAVHIDVQDNKFSTIVQLDEVSASTDLLNLIRPFVVIAADQVNDQSSVRLLHQSLKELILQATPVDWKSLSSTPTPSREAKLNEHLLRRCLNYLCLEECGSYDLLPASEITWPAAVEGLEFLVTMGAYANDVADDNSSTASFTAAPEQDFKPADCGLGLFFTYASLYWTDHLSETEADLGPSAIDLVQVCSKGSRRLRNWVEQWQHPSCSYVSERSFPNYTDIDPLVVTAMFGPSLSVIDISKYIHQAHHFSSDSLWIAIKHLMRRQMVPTIKALVTNSHLRATLWRTKFFYNMVSEWYERGCLKSAFNEWEDILELLIK